KNLKFKLKLTLWISQIFFINLYQIIYITFINNIYRKSSEELTIINMAFLHFIASNFKNFLNLRLRD
ncbi:hypothetical protein ABPG72_020839, partial [Tetrahymena utriculariae]